MRYALAVVLFVSACPLHAGMMGNGMRGSGMMDGNAKPATPPPKNADPVLRRGFDLTQRFCIQCHAAPNPLQHNAAQWPLVVARMQNYMRQQERAAPDTDQQRWILLYLEAGQRDP